MITAVPAYNSKSVQLSKVILQDVKRGEFKSIIDLPPQESLAKHYKTSRPTIRKAIQLIKQREFELKSKDDRQSVVSNGLRGDLAKKVGIGVVLPGYPDANFNEIQAGIRTYCEQSDVLFHVYLSRDGHENAIKIIENIQSYPCDGILVFPYNTSEYVRALSKLSREKIPVVCLDRGVDGLDMNLVGSDHAGGMYNAVEYIVSKYERPAYFLTTGAMSQPGFDRIQAYKSAMADAGYFDLIDQYLFIDEAKDEDVKIWPYEAKLKVGRKAAVALFDRIDLSVPISVVCHNTYIAKGVCDITKEVGLEIGRDVFVVGFDDIPLAWIQKPSMTVVRQDFNMVGYYAAMMLHEIISSEKELPCRSVHLPTELIVRESA